MSEPTLIQTKTALPVADIQPGQRLRPVSPAGVEAIVASIREIGHMSSPIVVRQKPRRGGGMDYVILDGAHRLAAAMQLGWTEVPVRVFECNDAQARLLEIDGNLAGAELNPLDTAVFLASRKAVYEALHPETRAGVAGARAKHGAANDMMSFAETTAQKFGMSRRNVERIVAAGSRLGPDEATRLRAAPRPVTLKDLQVIGDIGEAVERYEVVGMLAEGRAKSAAEATRLWRHRANPLPPLEPVDIEFRRLREAWHRARRVAQRRFLEEVYADITAQLAAMDAEADDAEREHR